MGFTDFDNSLSSLFHTKSSESFLAQMAEDCAEQFQCNGLWFESRSSLGFFSFLHGVTLKGNDPFVVPLLIELVHLQNYWFKRKDVSKMAYLKLNLLLFSVIDVPWKFRQKLSCLLHVTRTIHSSVCAYSSQGLEKPHLHEDWALRMPERYACNSLCIHFVHSDSFSSLLITSYLKRDTEFAYCSM